MAAAARRDVFQAIADPNRREMIRLLAAHTMNLNAIAERFDISRPAVSQHIKILTECGLIIIKQKGRERYCEAKLAALNEVADWVDEYKKFWTDNLNSLDKYLTKIQKKIKMQTKNQTGKEAALTVTKEFDAPIQLVFDALSNPGALTEWWGPVGYTMTVTEFDFNPGGICLFKMENKEAKMWARLIYGQIKSPELVEVTLSFSDENGGITRAPFFENWPLEILNVITLKEQDGKTTFTNNCFPVNATTEEISSFKENKLSFNQGLSASMEKLRNYLSNND